jgi:hypothetical protein
MYDIELVRNSQFLDHRCGPGYYGEFLKIFLENHKSL